MKISKYLFLLILSIFVCCKTETKKNTVQNEVELISVHNQSKVDYIDSLFQDLVSEKKSPGIVFGIKIDAAEPIVKSYGLSNISTDRKLDVNGQFRIASITKTFTSTAILMLVQQGKLSFDDTIEKFFPDFPKAEEITIYSLLSHTSGIPNWYEVEMPASTPSDFPMCETPHKYIQEMEKLFFFEPGEYYYYSNSGYVLLGEIIEQLSGGTYGQFLKENIFDTSGMTDTEMEFSKDKSPEWVKGYGYNEKDSIPFIDPETYPMPFSAGALRSTAADLIRFMTSLNSGKLISNELRIKATSYAKVNDGGDVDEDHFYFPTDYVRPEPPQGLSKFGYGLGFQLMEVYDTSVIFHVGSIAGFQSYLVYMPKNNTTIAMITNVDSGNTGIAPIWGEIQEVMVEIE